ncbi:MAG: hypothetical protein MUC49_15395 [Raineya sp.]|jgi:hypothetical protein|nr:hypothetical protein [Raineya sp.]
MVEISIKQKVQYLFSIKDVYHKEIVQFLSEKITRFYSIFGDIYSFPEIEDIDFYDLQLAERETLAIPRWNDHIISFPTDIMPPVDIDYEKCLLFADFGWGSDTPLALDYRENLENPSILLYLWCHEDDITNRWLKIAEWEDLSAYLRQMQ